MIWTIIDIVIYVFAAFGLIAAILAFLGRSSIYKAYREAIVVMRQESIQKHTGEPWACPGSANPKAMCLWVKCRGGKKCQIKESI